MTAKILLCIKFVKINKTDCKHVYNAYNVMEPPSIHQINNFVNLEYALLNAGGAVIH